MILSPNPNKTPTIFKPPLLLDSHAATDMKLYRYLCDEKKEFVLSKQIVRSGTSIGANVEEAIGGQSNKDFLSKMSIAYKEARETHYWLRLLRDSDILEAKHAESVIEDCEELLKLSGSIIRTTKSKIPNS